MDLMRKDSFTESGKRFQLIQRGEHLFHYP